MYSQLNHNFILKVLKTCIGGVPLLDPLLVIQLENNLSLIGKEGNPLQTLTKLYPSFATRFTTTWGWSTSNTPYCASVAFALCTLRIVHWNRWTHSTTLLNSFLIEQVVSCFQFTPLSSRFALDFLRSRTYTHITNTSHLHIRAPRTYHYVSPTTTPLVI